MDKEIKILIVDDNPEDTSSFQQYLHQVKNINYRIDVAANFLDGFNHMLHNHHDIYFINAALGVHSGYELIEFAAKQHLSAPSVLLTTDESHGTHLTDAPVGLYDFLPKADLNKSVLERTIRYALAHKVVESHLHATKKQAELTLSSIKDGVIALTRDGTIAYLNPAAAALLGGNISEFMDTALFEEVEFIDLARNLVVNHEIKSALDKHVEFTQQQELSLKNKSHKQYDIELVITPIDTYQTSYNGLATSAIITLRNVTETKQLANKLLFESTHDTLTRLPNRRLLADRISRTLLHAKRYKYIFAVLFIDLDGFKQINETHGHHYGDAFLDSVATRLQQNIRSSDTVARFGGDEFIVLLSNLHHAEDAGKVSEMILKLLAQPFIVENEEHYITASIGIAVYPDDGKTEESLIKNADSAMYLAKSKGKNNFQFYTPDLNDAALEKLKLTNDFRSSLQKGYFEIYYQPQIDCQTNKTIAIEALIRWNHPKKGIIPPDKFIPIAEENGLIGMVGDWVFRTAAAQLQQWVAAGLTHVKMTINCSGQQFERKNIVEDFLTIVEEHGLSPQMFILEITESVFIRDASHIIDRLKELRDKGFEIAMDDFGTGYSCLNYLKSLPVDIIKIDQSFIKNVTSNSCDAGIIKAIIALANSLHIHVLAEGVETAAQRDFLLANHCYLMQGYLFSQPLAAKEMLQYFEQASPHLLNLMKESH